VSVAGSTATIFITGYVPNTRIINTTEGIQGGGDLSVNRTLKMDINGLSAINNRDSNDYLVVYDQDSATHKKILASDFVSGLGGAGGSGGLPIFDDGVFKTTGTALSFDAGLDVVVTGTNAYVNIRRIGVDIYDDSDIKLYSGTAISFAENLSVVTTGNIAYVSATGSGGGGLTRGQILAMITVNASGY
jgi:hypothetical protein